MSDKILIIGAKGMLGQELAKILDQQNPVLWDLEEIDITDAEQVAEKIGELRPAIIINCAAYNDVDGAENNQELANKINGEAVGFLAETAAALGSILVHYSTDYVFRGDQKSGYRESDQPEPQSAYASSKYLGEQKLQEHTDKFYLIRLSRLFGRPAASQQAKKSFVDLMLELAQTKEELNVVNEELSSPTYAPDLARGTVEIINGKMPFGVYHVANSGACTWYEFAQEIFKIKRIKTKINPVSGDFYPRSAQRPAYSILLNTKIKKRRPWRQALVEYLNLLSTKL